jgi:hypothetical protein
MSDHRPAGPAARPAPGLRQARLIRRLRETLFELQCDAEPDAVAIDRLMRRLARVRGRGAPSFLRA